MKLCRSKVFRSFALVVSGLLFAFGFNSAFAQELFLDVDYRNQIYTGTPTIPDVTLTQPESVAIYSGSIAGLDENNNVVAPSDGTNQLARSSFGHPVGENLVVYVDFGGVLPSDLVADVDPSVTPMIINPPEVVRAIYVSDTDQVIATDPGIVEVVWKKTDGSDAGKIRYRITERPDRDPMILYHTHLNNSFGLDGDENPIQEAPDTRAPVVDVSSVETTIFHYNTAIPDGNALDRIQISPTNAELWAKASTGLILAEYRGVEDVLLGFEIIELKENVSEVDVSPVYIGDRLLPERIVSDAALPVATIGKAPDNRSGHVYQHDFGESVQEGELYAIRKTVTEDEIEIYWRRRGLEDIEWPYELHYYTADWPTDGSSPDDYQRYVRSATQVNLGGVPGFGPDVILSPDLNAFLMPFQEPVGHAGEVAANTFSTNAAGWSLLRYMPGDRVAFQVVRSVLHTDASEFNLSANAWDIGAEITDPSHEGPRMGYLHIPTGTLNRYDPEIYDWAVNGGEAGVDPSDPGAVHTQQIFAVNTDLLEVWWSNLNDTGNFGDASRAVQWPSLVKSYQADWPASPESIVIADQNGTGAIDPNVYRDYTFYYQNDPNLDGYNPNDEHALIRPYDSAQAIFPLRSDLGSAATSLPYVLMKYRDPADNLLWRYRVFEVTRGNLQATGTAGTLIQPLFPLSTLPYLEENYGVSGPFWQDRKDDHWARAGGDDGGTTQIVMHHYYTVQEGFFFPSTYPVSPEVGNPVPWLDLSAGTPGTPADVTYTISWPEEVPVLKLGETLFRPKFGLPAIQGQCGVEIIYQQSRGLGDVGTEVSATLIDPTRAYTVPLDSLPDDVAVENSGGRVYFSLLPPHLRERISYDPVNRRLELRGVFVEAIAGEDYVLPNILTDRDVAVLQDPEIMGSDPLFQTALSNLATLADAAIEITDPDDNSFDSLALTAGLATAGGYVTLAMQNNENRCDPALPVSLEIIRVDCDLYTGELKVVEPPCVFDEKLTLRHSGDFAGKLDDYEFEWYTSPDVNGLFPQVVDAGDPGNDWVIFPDADGGVGRSEITIGGPGLLTLSDNWFITRYRKNIPGCEAGAWSAWTRPQLAEGWIKRVLAGINPFNQRFEDLGDPTRQINTLVTMISQAGPRWEGSVPLNCDTVDDFGLIEIYETILNRGIELSIDGTPPVNYPPANNALLLVASRLSSLYALLGNEAFADASDPTIGFGLDANQAYLAPASSLHPFMNMTGSLLEEELTLLRGRDDLLAPGVRVPPFYNRLIWNFAGGDGEVAYALNYDIQDAPGEVDGVLDEADAKVNYPQGHGDAWGHYLMALKNYYRLLRDDDFTWVPKTEAVLIGGVPVTVDFVDERKFARAAAAKARAGAEIINLTYRSAYVEDPEGQWQGYKDSDAERTWGLAEWGSRAGQGTLIDWIVGNALLPENYAQGYSLSQQSVDLIGADSEYQLTPTRLEQIEGSGLLSNDVITLLRNAPELNPPFFGRQSFLLALDDVLGVNLRTRYQSAILNGAQTVGIPEKIMEAVETLKGQRFDSMAALEQGLEDIIGTEQKDLYWTAIEARVVEPDPEAELAGIQKIDRNTVTELDEVASILSKLQAEVDKADSGLNPLGLAKNVVPFDISPTEIDAGKTHFEQIYDRAVAAMNNAITVFNYANGSTQQLRLQADVLADFNQNVTEREADFNNRLIEIFGYPYPEDIGGAGTYPSGYTGADVYHFMYDEPSEFFDVDATLATASFTVNFKDLSVDSDGGLTEVDQPVIYRMATNGLGFVKPEGWSQRRAKGRLQMTHTELLLAKGRFERALLEYDNLIAQIQQEADLLELQLGVNAQEIEISYSSLGTQEQLNDKIRRANELQMRYSSGARIATIMANAVAEALPSNLVVGFSTGGDLTSVARSAIRLAGGAVTEALTQKAEDQALKQLDHSQAKEIAQAQTGIELTVLRQVVGIEHQLGQLRNLIRQEASMRLELYSLEEAMQQVSSQYFAVLAEGERLLEERLRFRQNTASEVQERRYKDMAFRVFRNDALQKYRAQFDLAAAYVYMAARAYDFETNLLESDAQGPGQDFLTDIVRSRALGHIEGGIPQTASNEGDPGLADAMARMSANWSVLEGQLGFNNPQQETNRFSLREEFFRIPAFGSDNNRLWKETLERHIVDNILDLPEFERFARVFDPTLAEEPALVIPFETNINFGLNFFGFPAGPGDSFYDSTNFATKVRSVGVWFSNYNTSGLTNTPSVYLIPVGEDVMRSPTNATGAIRQWRILDQRIPPPFALTPVDLDNNLNYIPIESSLNGTFAEQRRFSSFRAYHDSGNFDPAQVTSNSRLIGRSVWNTRWLLVIPAGTLLNDRDEAIQRFIHGQEFAPGQRDGNGISDIKFFFNTYSYSGN